MYDFSFCIIAKNEEKHLEKCLKPLQQTGQEIIVLDTGSTDHTIAIAERYTPHIYHFDWTDDFSEARNYAMKKASNDHILFLDADEYTEAIDVSAIKKLIREYPDAIGRITRRNACFSGDSSEPRIMTDLVERLFDRRLFHYTGRIHEQVTHRKNMPLYGYDIPLTVYHNGYLGTLEERRQKAERNNRLLFEELKQTPDDPYLYYQLGQSFGLCGDAEQEYIYYHKGCSLPLELSLDYVKIMLVSYGYAMLATDRRQEAMKLQMYYPSLSSYADFVCMLGCVFMENKEYFKAMRFFRLTLPLTEYHVEGANNAIPWHNLGCIYEAFGSEEEALSCYENALKYNSPLSGKRYASLLEQQKHSRHNRAEEDKYIALLIPCENAAASLDGLFCSLEEQTIGLTHLQLIFLDFASKDATWKKLNTFEQKHPQSVMLFQFTEEITGSAEYTLMDHFISGGLAEEIINSYVCASSVGFLSPKDRLHMDYLRQYYQIAQNYTPQIICCLTASIIEDEDAFYTHLTPDTAYSLLQITGDQARARLSQAALLDHPLAGALYSKSYLESDKILTPDISNDIKKTDALLKTRICLSVQTICYINDALFYTP